MVTKEKTGKKKGDTDCTHLRSLLSILPLETYPRESEYPSLSLCWLCELTRKQLSRWPFIPS